VRKFRKKKGYTDRVLLDTTYILPILGVGMELKGFDEGFPKMFSKYEVFYNPVSLIEAKWVVLKICRSKPHEAEKLLKAYRKGLAALLSDKRIKQTTLTSPEAEEIADRLMEAGVKDYFDRMVYATAVRQEMILMTEDVQLIKITKANLPRPKRIINWNVMAEKIS
jgi:hypothetical protein